MKKGVPMTEKGVNKGLQLMSEEED
jgi:hypothetical protein